jgi:leucyl-tRNA synthetase
LEGDVAAGPARPALREALEALVFLLNPFTPHVCEEMGERLGYEDGLVRAPWPVADAEIAKEDALELPVQVNGKVRTRITVPREASEEQVRARALEAAQSHIEGKQVQKVVIVPHRLVSVVVR